MNLNLCVKQILLRQLEDSVVECGEVGTPSGDVVEGNGVGSTLIENSSVVLENDGLSAENEEGSEMIREDTESVREHWCGQWNCYGNW